MRLSCAGCGWSNDCSAAEMLGWLRQAQMVRRDAAPEPELLGELFSAAAGKLRCPKCGHSGLAAAALADDEDDEAWGMARKCDVCGRPIARERLAALPDVRLCVACQASDDRGAAPSEVEYCPRCGSVMTLVARQRGITRYELTCPSCRSR
jgi:DNA-directed RNA polymerase subunit M/transcription elongation factor TFIIS